MPPITLSRKPVRLAKTRPFVTFRDIRCVFHMASFLFFVRVWMWHTSSAAQVLAGSGEFGWFFRYLTFWAFTLQVFQLFSATLVDLSKPGQKFKLKRDSDDLACTVFAAANTVTLMYYVLHFMTGNVDEGPTRVRWIGSTVHILNSVVAWLDVLISSPRRFGPRSRSWSAGYSILYVAWINVIRLKTGKFPYPFLDSLPYPLGLVGLGVAGITAMMIFSCLGRALSKCGRFCFGKLEEFDPVWTIEEKAEAVRAKRNAERPGELYEDVKAD